MDKKIQTSESMTVGILLALAGGFFDIYSYMARGRVFANAQTGNMVLFGLKIAEGDWAGVIYYAVPIIAFITGVILAELIKGYYKGHRQIHWRQMVLLVEVFVVLTVMFIPQGETDIIVNAAISFVCSVQVQSFRKLKGSAFATTMCTGNLRTATDSMLQYMRTKDRALFIKSMDYYIIIGVFIIGAIIGGILTKLAGSVSVGFAVIPIIIAIIVMKNSGDDVKAQE